MIKIKSKNHIKVFVALVFSMVLAAGSVGSVSGTQQNGTLVGENNVTEMVLSVLVPTDLHFTIDPFEINSVGGNQIGPANYMFVNKTGAPVKITMEIEVILAEGVELVGDPLDLDKDDDTVKDKKLFFAILGADELQPEVLEGSGAPGEVTGVYNTESDTLIPFDPATGKATITFALAPELENAENLLEIPLEETMTDGEEDVLTPNDMNAAAFQFFSELNTYADWADGDVKVSGTYTISPLRASTYDGYFTNGAFTEGGWNTQLKPVQTDNYAPRPQPSGEPQPDPDQGLDEMLEPEV